MKNLLSVSTESAAAPPDSYPLAIATGSKSSLNMPFDGEACFISAIILSPPDGLMAEAKSRGILEDSARRERLSRERDFPASATSRRVFSIIVSRIVPVAILFKAHYRWFSYV